MSVSACWHANGGPDTREGSCCFLLVVLETDASRDDRPQMHMHPRFLRAGLWRTSNKYKLSAQQKLNSFTQQTILILTCMTMGRTVLNKNSFYTNEMTKGENETGSEEGRIALLM